MSSDFTSIRAALEKRVDTATGIPPVARQSLENQKFTPPDNDTWVRLRLRPSLSRAAVAGPSPQKRTQGLFLIDVFAPADNGPGVADSLADNIIEVFEPGDVLTEGAETVRIEYTERSSGLNDGDWYFVPVSVAWYAYQ